MTTIVTPADPNHNTNPCIGALLLKRLVPDVVYPQLRVHEYSIATAYVRNVLGIHVDEKVLFVFRGPPKTIHGRRYDYTATDKRVGENVILSGMKKLNIPDYVVSSMNNNVKVVYVFKGEFIGTGKISKTNFFDNTIKLSLEKVISNYEMASISRIIERVYNNFKMSDEFQVVKSKTIGFKKHCVITRVVNAEVVDGNFVRSFVLVKLN